MGVETELLIRKLCGQRGNDVLSRQKGPPETAIVGPLSVAVLRQSENDWIYSKTVQMRLGWLAERQAVSGRAGLCTAELNTRAVF